MKLFCDEQQGLVSSCLQKFRKNSALAIWLTKYWSWGSKKWRFLAQKWRQ